MWEDIGCSLSQKSMKNCVTIANITTTVFRLPLREPLRWGKHSVLDELRHVLVQVILSDGAYGMAEAPPRPTIYGETVYSICSIIEHELKPRLLGHSAHDLSSMAQIKNNHTAKGALDTAVQDALAQSAGVSLAEYLGCAGTAILVSYILGISDDASMLAEAQRVFDQGVRVLKVKVGRDWSADVRRLRALLTQFGGAMQLYADANECFVIENAATRLDQLREMGILYCEEPLPVEQIQARSRLQSGQHLPIIADDSTFTERDLRRELALDTFDILNIKTARTGYTASKKMLALAQQASKGVMVGSQASSALGTARAGLFAALPGINHPSELSFFLKLKEEIIVNPPPIHEGVIQVADLLNVKIDPDLLKAAPAVI